MRRSVTQTTLSHTLDGNDGSLVAYLMLDEGVKALCMAA